MFFIINVIELLHSNILLDFTFILFSILLMETYFYVYLAITLKLEVYKSKFFHHFINIILKSYQKALQFYNSKIIDNPQNK